MAEDHRLVSITEMHNADSNSINKDFMSYSLVECLDRYIPNIKKPTHRGA